MLNGMLQVKLNLVNKPVWKAIWNSSLEHNVGGGIVVQTTLDATDPTLSSNHLSFTVIFIYIKTQKEIYFTKITPGDNSNNKCKKT